MTSNARVQRRRSGTTLFPLLAVVWLLVAVAYHSPSAPIEAKDEPVRDALGAVPVRITVLHAAPPLAAVPEPVVEKRAVRKKSVKRNPAPRTELPGARKGYFIVRGRIFDLTTLAPVSGATVRLKDGDTETMSTVATDAKGRYRISLKSNGTGYALSIRHPLYSRRVLEDWGVSFRDMSPAQREQAASDSLGRQLNTIILSMPGQVIEQDYAVLPLRRTAAD